MPHSNTIFSPAVLRLGVHLLEAVCAVAFLVYKMRAEERRPLSDAGITWRGVVSETVAGFAIGAALLSAVFGILWLLGDYSVFGLNYAFEPWLPLMSFAGIAVFEEVMFRGFLFRIVEYRSGSLTALVVSSLVFGLLHFLNVANAPIPLAQKLAGPLFICLEAGALLGAAYMATRRLWLPIGIHSAWNFCEGSLYGSAVSGNAIDNNVLLRSSLHGPWLFTGGEFGPEGSVICLLIGSLLGAALLLVATKSGQWKPAGGRRPQAASSVDSSAGA